MFYVFLVGVLFCFGRLSGYFTRSRKASDNTLAHTTRTLRDAFPAFSRQIAIDNTRCNVKTDIWHWSNVKNNKTCITPCYRSTEDDTTTTGRAAAGALSPPPFS
uniref:Putative secreted protein n=1 Tax=Anopheles marajoara TaxID=58244 RepID=A0A2M4C8H1_9DIPT